MLKVIFLVLRRWRECARKNNFKFVYRISNLFCRSSPVSARQQSYNVSLHTPPASGLPLRVRPPSCSHAPRDTRRPLDTTVFRQSHQIPAYTVLLPLGAPPSTYPHGPRHLVPVPTWTAYSLLFTLTAPRSGTQSPHSACHQFITQPAPHFSNAFLFLFMRTSTEAAWIASVLAALVASVLAALASPSASSA